MLFYEKNTDIKGVLMIAINLFHGPIILLSWNLRSQAPVRCNLETLL